MQSDLKEIIKMTAARTKKDEKLYADISSCVFTQLSATMKRPPTLITKLRGVGSWYLRRRRMQIYHNRQMPNPTQRDESDFTSEYTFKEYENKREIREMVKARLEDYKEYIKERDEVRKIRYKTQSLIEPPKDEEDA